VSVWEHWAFLIEGKEANGSEQPKTIGSYREVQDTHITVYIHTYVACYIHMCMHIHVCMLEFFSVPSPR
jgi:hypothetical protein